MTWRVQSLNDLVELQRGHDLPESTRSVGAVPVIGSFGITGWHDVALYDAPGVAIGRSGSIGTATWVDQPFWPLNTCLFARDFKGNDPRWIYWVLHLIDFSAYNSGSAQPSLNRNFLRSIPVNTPDLPTQQAIADALGALNDKIAASRQVVEVGDWLISAVIERHLKKRHPLWDAIDFTFGEAFKGEQFSEPTIGRPLIRIRDIKSQRCQVWTTEVRARERLVQGGEVLVGMDAEFRATRWSGPEGLLNQRVLLASSGALGNAITREVLREPLKRIERSKSGTTVIHLNKSDLLRETAVVPEEGDVADLRAVVDPVWDRCVAAEHEIARLAATRDELLPLLMDGRITVRDAKNRVEGEV